MSSISWSEPSLRAQLLQDFSSSLLLIEMELFLYVGILNVQKESCGRQAAAIVIGLDMFLFVLIDLIPLFNSVLFFAFFDWLFHVTFEAVR
jgi:hypothetical protein